MGIKINDPKIKNKVGRPTDFTPEISSLICERVATHAFGLKRLCKIYDDMPDESTVYLWRIKNKEFSQQYAQAKMRQADLLAEECIDIADDDSQDIKVNDEGYETFNGEFVARSRLRIDTRKWMASKLLPKQYGERRELEEERDKNEALRQEIIILRAKLDAENKRDY